MGLAHNYEAVEHVKDLLLEAVEMAQRVKCLPHQLEALSLDPQHPVKKQVHLYKSVPPPQVGR